MEKWKLDISPYKTLELECVVTSEEGEIEKGKYKLKIKNLNPKELKDVRLLLAGYSKLKDNPSSQDLDEKVLFSELWDKFVLESGILSKDVVMKWGSSTWSNLLHKFMSLQGVDKKKENK